MDDMQRMMMVFGVTSSKGFQLQGVYNFSLTNFQEISRIHFF